jgi:hypothetical protein
MKIHGPAWCRALLMAAAVPAFAADSASQRDPRSASGAVTAAKAVAPAPVPPPIQAPVPAVVNTVQQERDEVLKAFETWMRAWNAKDMEAYFGMYAKEFRPADGTSRETWERHRRIRISGKSYINVRAEQPRLNVQGDKATISFVQIYLSDKLRDETHKVLHFSRIGGKWLIMQERTAL